MSLFENPEYRWRETFFVLFEDGSRPQASTVQAEMKKLGKNFEVSALRANDDGELESVTVFSRDDFAAMDISCVTGEEVTDQVDELVEQLIKNAETADEKSQVERIPKCTARFDVLHFEQHSFDISEDDMDNDFMDPGGLLLILERLGTLCNGIVVDPQSDALL